MKAFTFEAKRGERCWSLEPEPCIETPTLAGIFTGGGKGFSGGTKFSKGKENAWTFYFCREHDPDAGLVAS